MRYTHLPPPCHLCGLAGAFETIDVSGESCGSSGTKPCPACIQLKQLDDRITETTSLLQSLFVQRHEIKFKRNQYHDQLIKRLPLELVSRIFAFCHQFLPIHDSKAFHTFQRLRIGKEQSGITPWTLAVVCKSWRDVVWSTPQLWTSVVLNTSLGSERSYLEFAQEWLSRSGGLPVSLSLYEGRCRHRSYMPEEARMEKPRALFDIINKSSPRWKALNVCVSDNQLNYLCGDSSGTWILEDLYFESFYRPDTASTKTCIFGTHTKPAPKRISVYNVNFSHVDITWDRLTHIKVSLFTIADCWEIFIHAHRMTRCTFHSVDRQVSQSPPLPQPIVHTVLQVFKDLSLSSLGLLFDSLTLPSLQELCIPTDHLSHAASLVARSACRITRLDVYGWSFGQPLDPEGHLIALLEQMPYLTDLTLSHAPISNTFFERLGSIVNTPSQSLDAASAEEFLPVLRSLKVRSPLSFQWECLADMFTSRSDVPKPPRRALRSFEVKVVEVEASDVDENSDPDLPWHCDPLPEDVVQSLLAVREGGVKMRIMEENGIDLLPISPDSD